MAYNRKVQKDCIGDLASLSAPVAPERSLFWASVLSPQVKWNNSGLFTELRVLNGENHKPSEKHYCLVFISKSSTVLFAPPKKRTHKKPQCIYFKAIARSGIQHWKPNLGGGKYTITKQYMFTRIYQDTAFPEAYHLTFLVLTFLFLERWKQGKWVC